MSNEKKWAEEQQEKDRARNNDLKDGCLHCGAPVTLDSPLCAACDARS